MICDRCHPYQPYLKLADHLSTLHLACGWCPGRRSKHKRDMLQNYGGSLLQTQVMYCSRSMQVYARGPSWTRQDPGPVHFTKICSPLQVLALAAIPQSTSLAIHAPDPRRAGVDFWGQ